MCCDVCMHFVGYSAVYMNIVKYVNSCVNINMCIQICVCICVYISICPLVFLRVGTLYTLEYYTILHCPSPTNWNESNFNPFVSIDWRASLVAAAVRICG